MATLTRVVALCTPMSLHGGVGQNAKSERVREQYEVFPFPELGDPSSETDRRKFLQLYSAEPRLLQADHYIYGGRLFSSRRPSKAVPWRILVAGGGVGQEAVYWAKDLEDNYIQGSVTYFDFSGSAVALARAWVDAFKLAHRVTLHHSSLASFAQQHATDDAPLFDIIICTGVLHHLEDPLAGLVTLRRLLVENGGMHVMLYGKYGRSGVYDMQQALRYALPPETLTDKERVNALRGLLDTSGLPHTSACHNNLLCNPGSVAPSPAAILDKFLHTQDIAYSVPELDALIQSAGLRVVTFDYMATYEPDYTVFQTSHAKQSLLATQVRNRSRLEQFHFAELFTSRPSRHDAWLAHCQDNDSAHLYLSNTVQEHRQLDYAWRHVMKLVIPNFAFLYSATQISTLKSWALARKQGVFELDFQASGMAKAKVPFPLLAFAFDKAVRTCNTTAEGVIQGVTKAAERWSGDAYTVPLSYKEVAEQFFEWFDKMETLGAVFGVERDATAEVNSHFCYLE